MKAWIHYILISIIVVTLCVPIIGPSVAVASDIKAGSVVTHVYTTEVRVSNALPVLPILKAVKESAGCQFVTNKMSFVGAQALINLHQPAQCFELVVAKPVSALQELKVQEFTTKTVIVVEHGARWIHSNFETKFPGVQTSQFAIVIPIITSEFANLLFVSLVYVVVLLASFVVFNKKSLSLLQMYRC